MASQSCVSGRQPSKPAKTSIHNLPVELTQMIIAYLDNKSLAALHSTSRKLWAHSERDFSQHFSPRRSEYRAQKVHFVTVYPTIHPLQVQVSAHSLVQLWKALKKFPNLRIVAAADFDDDWASDEFKEDRQSNPFGLRQIQRMTGQDVPRLPHNRHHHSSSYTQLRENLIEFLVCWVQSRPDIQLHVAAQFESPDGNWDHDFQKWEEWKSYIHRFSWLRSSQSRHQPRIGLNPEILWIKDGKYMSYEFSDLRNLCLENNLGKTVLRLKHLKLHQVVLDLLQIFRVVIASRTLRMVEMDSVALMSEQHRLGPTGIFFWTFVWTELLEKQTLQSLRLSRLCWIESADDIQHDPPAYAINSNDILGTWTREGTAENDGWLERCLSSLISQYQQNVLSNRPSRIWVDLSEALELPEKALASARRNQ